MNRSSETKRLLPFNDLREKKGIVWTRQHILRETRAKRFPPPINLGGQTIAWVESEIDAWLDQRIAERDRKNEHAA